MRATCSARKPSKFLICMKFPIRKCITQFLHQKVTPPSSITWTILAFQKQPPEAFYEKRCSWKFRKIHRKTPLVCEIFKNTYFYGTPLDDCFWFFRILFLKITKCILERQKIIFNNSFDLIIFIFQQGKRLMMERDFLAEVVQPAAGLMLSSAFIQMH